MSSFNNTPNFDNLLLQSLMGRLQIQPPNPLHSPPFLNQTLEDLLLDSLNLSDNDDDESDDNKTQLAKEESKLEKDIIKTILSNKTETLKPNSGQAVTIGEHHICVGFHEETGSDYRVWEWHGHIMLFDEENGYTPEYIYGNYFERITVKTVVVAKENDDEKKDDQMEEKVGNLGGLRELIDSGDLSTRRILHRNISAGSPRLLAYINLAALASGIICIKLRVCDRLEASISGGLQLMNPLCYIRLMCLVFQFPRIEQKIHRMVLVLVESSAWRSLGADVEDELSPMPCGSLRLTCIFNGLVGAVIAQFQLSNGIYFFALNIR